jgi:hypothetical protein
MQKLRSAHTSQTKKEHTIEKDFCAGNATRVIPVETQSVRRAEPKVSYPQKQKQNLVVGSKVKKVPIGGGPGESLKETNGAYIAQTPLTGDGQKKKKMKKPRAGAAK